MGGSRSVFASVGLRAAEGLALLAAVSIALVIPGQLGTNGPPGPETLSLPRLAPGAITVAAPPLPAAQTRKRQRLAVSARPSSRASNAPAASARASGRPDHHTGTNPAAGQTEPVAPPPSPAAPTPAVAPPEPTSPPASPPTTTAPPTTAGAGPSTTTTPPTVPVPTQPQTSTPTARPGWGNGDTNHVHTGPPGQPPPTTPPPTTTAEVVETQASSSGGGGQPDPGSGLTASDNPSAQAPGDRGHSNR
jgi:hypothetical protein